MTTEIEQLWQNFLDSIYKEINAASFHAWFHDLILLSIDRYQQKLKIQVPMEIHKNILGEHYYSLIEETFFKLTGINFEIEFLLEEEKDHIVENFQKEIIQEPEKVIEREWETNLISELNFENYMVGDSNRLAKVAGMAVAEAPGKIHNPLFIYGKSGLGKTHLMHAIGNYIVEHSNKKVLYTTSDMFMNDYTGIANLENKNNTIEYANSFKNKYRNVDVLIIDDIQYLVGAEKTQQEFFHTFNALHQANKQIIISSDRSPDDLKILEERLRSRFMWGLPVDIYPPDFELRCKIIRQKVKNTSIANKVDEDVVEFIANSCQNDVRFLEGAINRLMAYTAMVVPNHIDLEFANEALKDFINKNIYSENSIEGIQQAVADYYHITVADLKGKKKSANIAYPRQVGMYLCRMMTDETFPRIGLEFGGRDHSTVIHACDKIEKDLKTNPTLVNSIKEIKNKV